MQLLLVSAILVSPAEDRASDEPAPESSEASSPQPQPRSDDDWPDLSEFLDEKYGFLPIALPVTDPAVGYGAAGAVAFLSRPLGEARDGLGRPSITSVGGLGTENGTWAAAAGDLRYWLDDRIQTTVAAAYGSVNLEFFGIGKDSVLDDDPLDYNLETAAGFAQAKYRIGDTLLWIGLAYGFAATEVDFEPLPGTPGLPDFSRHTNAGGVTPTLTYDSRDNIFTPVSGTYVEAGGGIFSEALGGDDEFQRARIIAMQYIPLYPKWTLGFRGEVAASFGDEPFYLRPFITLRGAPILRYQGEEMAQIEAELRWQFWQRFSLVGFVGGGAVWNDFERFDDTQSVVTGGGGFRYELARKYGIHMGLDVAFDRDNTAIYLQIGSAWARP